MSRKHILRKIKSFWYCLHNPTVSFKKHTDNEFFMEFRELIRNGLSNSNSYPQKEILNYITSRNMRRTIVPSDFINDQCKVNFLNKNEIIQRMNKYIAGPMALKVLKFHSKTKLLGNLISKQSSQKETQEEIELSWGGSEIYKLITIIKNFDEVLEKNAEVVVFFSAHWCKHCTRLRKPYGAAAVMAKEANMPVVFAMFDVLSDPDVAIENGIVGIPMIKYYRKGKYLSTFTGKRTAEELFEFVKNPEKGVAADRKPDI